MLYCTYVCNYDASCLNKFYLISSYWKEIVNRFIKASHCELRSEDQIYSIQKFNGRNYFPEIPFNINLRQRFS